MYAERNMSTAPAGSRYSQEPFVRSILCVTDFSQGSMTAFAHALMLAMNLRYEFTLLHASKAGERGEEWPRVPRVRQLLERWGYLDPGSPQQAVFQKVAVQVKKVRADTENALGAMLEYLERNPTDLVVLGTRGSRGVASWLRPSLPEAAIKRSRTMTLFVPGAARGFVSLERGGFTLKHILVPVNSVPNPHPAVTYAFRTAVFSSEEIVRMSLLHVGSAGEAPKLNFPERPYLSWEMLHRTGNVAEEIVKAGAQSDLIVMTTEGREGILDGLRGSVTRDVLRSAPCPVLTVPLGR